MSGDVQPRKRKDKKKRKDEGGEAYSPLASNEDVNIHVHKEGGTGGNICGKIVFFFLFSALIVLVGLIIKENQGLNDLENLEEESRYSQIFEGWLDTSSSDHNHEENDSPEVLHDHDDHELDDDDELEQDEHDSEDEETEDEESQELEESEEQEIEDDEESMQRSEETVEETEEDDKSRESEEDNDTIEDNETEEQEDSDEEKDNKDISDDQDESNQSEASRDDNDDDDDDEQKETKDQKSEEQKDVIEEKTVRDYAISKEIESNVEAKQEEARDTKGEAAQDIMVEKKSDEPQQGGTGMVTKIGVGLALLVVAYNVLIRKRRSDTFERPTLQSTDEKISITPDLSRRNTIVPPPSLQEVELDLPEDIDQDEEVYSEDEYSDDDSRSEHRSAREEYQELRSTYTRSMTPEGEFKVKNKQLEDDVLSDEENVEEELGEEELEDEEEIEYDDDEDERLLKRLEAKYGKLGRDVNISPEGEVESESDKQSEGDSDYEYSNITNKEDYKIKQDIDTAQKQLHKNAAYANKLFEMLIEKNPLSSRSLFGKATALDILAEQRKSNELLQQALNYYLKVLNAPDVPNPLYISVAERYIDRARFIGQYKKAVGVHWQLIERFPENVTYLNNLAVTYLTINLVEEARSVLKRVLSRWSDDGFALVHYGFILKTTDNNLEASVEYMVKGIKTKAPGVIDGRFYFHLGDALARLGKTAEAMKVYEEGVQEKVFLSKYQRSLYNIPRLTAKPWWEPSDLDLPPYQNLILSLKRNWKAIRKEGLSALNEKGFFQDEAENLKDSGTWKQFELFARGQKSSKNCAKCPVTCGVIQSFSDASGCKRGQTKFSVMHPETHVWSHCGPTNCRLRIHLGLKVPSKTFIRVAENTRSWNEGEVIIFDDSFEHEVWHNGTDFRLVLIVDVWHPELTASEKRSLTPI